MRGKPVPLTRKEYEVLCVLAYHAGTVLTKEQIYQAVWKNSCYSKGTHVSDQISSLRVKLGLSSKDTTYIRTVFGVGSISNDSSIDTYKTAFSRNFPIHLTVRTNALPIFGSGHDVMAMGLAWPKAWQEKITFLLWMVGMIMGVLSSLATIHICLVTQLWSLKIRTFSYKA